MPTGKARSLDSTLNTHMNFINLILVRVIQKGVIQVNDTVKVAGKIAREPM